jgi:hypothetical protein
MRTTWGQKNVVSLKMFEYRCLLPVRAPPPGEPGISADPRPERAEPADAPGRPRRTVLTGACAPPTSRSATDHADGINHLCERQGGVVYINFCNARGLAPLHLAARVGAAAAARALLFHGADPALKTSDGFTAAQVAAPPRPAPPARPAPFARGADEHGCTRVCFVRSWRGRAGTSSWRRICIGRRAAAAARCGATPGSARRSSAARGSARGRWTPRSATGARQRASFNGAHPRRLFLFLFLCLSLCLSVSRSGRGSAPHACEPRVGRRARAGPRSRRRMRTRGRCRPLTPARGAAGGWMGARPLHSGPGRGAGGCARWRGREAGQARVRARRDGSRWGARRRGMARRC